MFLYMNCKNDSVISVKLGSSAGASNATELSASAPLTPSLGALLPGPSLPITHGVCVMRPRKILWPRSPQGHNPALDVAMVWSSSKYSLWVTQLHALGAKSVIYKCLATIALCALISAPC